MNILEELETLITGFDKAIRDSLLIEEEYIENPEYLEHFSALETYRKKMRATILELTKKSENEKAIDPTKINLFSDLQTKIKSYENLINFIVEFNKTCKSIKDKFQKIYHPKVEKINIPDHIQNVLLNDLNQLKNQQAAIDEQMLLEEEKQNKKELTNDPKTHDQMETSNGISDLDSSRKQEEITKNQQKKLNLMKQTKGLISISSVRQEKPIVVRQEKPIVSVKENDILRNQNTGWPLLQISNFVVGFKKKKKDNKINVYTTTPKKKEINYRINVYTTAQLMPAFHFANLLSNFIPGTKIESKNLLQYGAFSLHQTSNDLALIESKSISSGLKVNSESMKINKDQAERLTEALLDAKNFGYVYKLYKAKELPKDFSTYKNSFIYIEATKEIHLIDGEGERIKCKTDNTWLELSQTSIPEIVSLIFEENKQENETILTLAQLAILTRHINDKIIINPEPAAFSETEIKKKLNSQLAIFENGQIYIDFGLFLDSIEDQELKKYFEKLFKVQEFLTEQKHNSKSEIKDEKSVTQNTEINSKQENESEDELPPEIRRFKEEKQRFAHGDEEDLLFFQDWIKKTWLAKLNSDQKTWLFNEALVDLFGEKVIQTPLAKKWINALGAENIKLIQSAMLTKEGLRLLEKEKDLLALKFKKFKNKILQFNEFALKIQNSPDINLSDMDVKIKYRSLVENISEQFIDLKNNYPFTVELAKFIPSTLIKDEAILTYEDLVEKVNHQKNEAKDSDKKNLPVLNSPLSSANKEENKLDQTAQGSYPEIEQLKYALNNENRDAPSQNAYIKEWVLSLSILPGKKKEWLNEALSKLPEVAYKLENNEDPKEKWLKALGQDTLITINKVLLNDKVNALDNKNIKTRIETILKSTKNLINLTNKKLEKIKIKDAYEYLIQDIKERFKDLSSSYPDQKIDNFIPEQFLGKNGILNYEQFIQNQYKNSFINDLDFYIGQRKLEQATNKDSIFYKNFNTIWGRFFGYSAEQKKNAAQKFIDCLKGTPKSFNDEEIAILRSGRLGKTLKKWEEIIKLPDDFLRAERRKETHHSIDENSLPNTKAGKNSTK